MATLRTLSIDEFKSAYDKIKDDEIQQKEFISSLNYNHCQLIWALRDLKSQTTPENFEQHYLYPIIIAKLSSVGGSLVLKSRTNLNKLIKDKPILVKLEIINSKLTRLNEWINRFSYNENIPTHLSPETHNFYLKQFKAIYKAIYEDTEWTKGKYEYEYRAYNSPIHHYVEESILNFSFKVWSKRVLDEAPDSLEEKLFYFFSIKNDIPDNFGKDKDEVYKITYPVFLEDADKLSDIQYAKINNVDVFKDFINFQIDLINKQLGTANSQPTHLNTNQQIQRIKTSLSVPELALLFKLLSEVKPDIFHLESKEELLRFIRANFETKRSPKDGIGLQSLRNLFNKPEANAIDFWEKHFHTFRDDLKKIRENLSE